MESSVMEVDKHHMWKDLTWLVGSSLALLSNFGMSEGSLVGIEGQPTSWCIGSFINWLKYGRLSLTIKGRMGAAGTVPKAISLDVTIRIKLKPTLGWVPAPAVGPGMVMICGEGGSESNEESEEP